MAAKVIPMYRNRKHRDGQDDWRNRCLAYIGTLLEEFLAGSAMTKLSEITGSLFRHKADILGELALALIEKRHRGLLEQEYYDCPECKRMLKRRGMHKRPVESLGGTFELSRPYFYCSHCSLGLLYPLDEALGLSLMPLT